MHTRTVKPLDPSSESPLKSRIAKDPVCWMDVDQDHPPASCEFGGKTYYFCQVGCRDEFLKSPGQYADLEAREKQIALEQASMPQDVEYTCPMDPEVRKIGPGFCPKCGMALEPAVADLSKPLDESLRAELRDMGQRLFVSLALAVPAAWIAMSAMHGGDHASLESASIAGNSLAGFLTTSSRWIQAALVTPVVVWAGRPFFERAWDSIRSRNPNMFTLIGIGVGAAYLYSVIALLFPQIFPEALRDSHGGVGIYFESAGMIVALVCLGQVLELQARIKTQRSIQALLDQSPKQALRVKESFDSTVPAEEEWVLAESVLPGDLLRVRAGDRIPVDGVVYEGNTSVDESAFTGEALPVFRSKGDALIGGTLNGSGSILMRAQKTGKDTLLSQMIRLVIDAQRSRAPIQRIADQVSARFVPIVVLISVLTFFVWYGVGPEPRLGFAFFNAIAVLLIACPCAMGLATPMSILVATGRGAREGILFKNAEMLERLASVDLIAFDKTGTLTQGRPDVVEFETVGSLPEKKWLGMALAIERGSPHPLAEALSRFGRSRKADFFPARDVQVFHGEGVFGIVEGKQVRVGTHAFLDRELQRQYGHPLRLAQGLSETHERVESMKNHSNTLVYVAIEGEWVGLMGLQDRLKTSSVPALRWLRERGIKLVMLTGDGPAQAHAVARQLGIDEVYSSLLPHQKLEVIRDLKAKEYRVAMIGDGTNDAPALALADVGVAMANGTDVALEAAGVTLLKGDLLSLVRARRLSEKTLRNISQNLFFAMAYNGLGIPLAAGVLYPFFGLLLSPVFASAAMSFSSVSVVLNALRLSRTQLKLETLT